VSGGLDKVFQACYGVWVYFKGSGVKIPRYPVTVTGKILPRNFSSNDHWETGKIGRKIAHKPGDFGIPDIV
jgi:hypothetical protein